MSALGEVIAQRVAAFRASQKLETNGELELERLYLRSLRRAVRGSLRPVRNRARDRARILTEELLGALEALARRTGRIRTFWRIEAVLKAETRYEDRSFYYNFNSE
jgi:hypothetical protein